MNSRSSLCLRSAYRRSDLGPAGNLVESRRAINVLIKTNKATNKEKKIRRAI